MRSWGWVVPLLITSCAVLRPPLGQGSALMIVPRFLANTQAILDPNTVVSVATLDIVPTVEVTAGSYSPISAVTGSPTTWGAQDMLRLTAASPSILANRPFVLRRLKPNKNYRVIGRAYNSANQQISIDASSSVDVAVTSDDAPSMATLPIHFVDTPFGANTSVTVLTDGLYDYLKGTLYQGSTQLAIAQAKRSNPRFTFSNLQGGTNYRLVVEAYKFGTMMASTSLDLNITNETAPVYASLPLTIPTIVSTIVGNGVAASSDGVGTAASLYSPVGIAVDPLGNLYVGEQGSHIVRKIAFDGTTSKLAGSGAAGYTEGTGASAVFNRPNGIALDAAGNVYVADRSNHSIRKITPAGVVSTLAGSGAAGFAEGQGALASFNEPAGIAVDSQGNVYVGDYQNQRIRKITSTGLVSTLAGNGSTGYVDAVGTSAVLSSPHGVAVDFQDNVYVADLGAHRIRKITPAGSVSTLAGCGVAGATDGTGTAAKLYSPWGIAVDAQGNVYVGEMGNRKIRKITPNGVVTTLAGNGTGSYADGTGAQAMFNSPHGMAVDLLGNVYVSDISNNRIRKLQ